LRRYLLCNYSSQRGDVARDFDDAGGIGTNGGVLAYHLNDDGAARLPLTFITETTLPDGARKLINDAIQAEWVALQVSPVDIWRECLAMQLRANLSDMSNGGRGSQWRVVNMINAHGGW
jgi:hypothetical protein